MLLLKNNGDRKKEPCTISYKIILKFSQVFNIFKMYHKYFPIRIVCIFVSLDYICITIYLEEWHYVVRNIFPDSRGAANE